MRRKTAAISKKEISQAADELREIVNWLAVFKEEYDLPDEVVSRIRERVQHAAEHLA